MQTYFVSWLMLGGLHISLVRNIFGFDWWTDKILVHSANFWGRKCVKTAQFQFRFSAHFHPRRPRDFHAQNSNLLSINLHHWLLTYASELAALHEPVFVPVEHEEAHANWARHQQDEGEEGAGQPRPGGNCIKMSLPGKLFLGDYFQENRTSWRHFLSLRIRFPGRYIFIQFIPADPPLLQLHAVIVEDLASEAQHPKLPRTQDGEPADIGTEKHRMIQPQFRRHVAFQGERLNRRAILWARNFAILQNLPAFRESPVIPLRRSPSVWG